MTCILPLINILDNVGNLGHDFLAGAGADDGLTNLIMGSCSGAMSVLKDVGIGIASIFLLFVVFVYITNILDGGKFQVKMLLPLLIYLCVLNYEYIAAPVVKFASIIQKKSIEAMEKVGQEAILKETGGKECSGMLDAYLKMADNYKPQSKIEENVENADKDEVDVITDTDITKPDGAGVLADSGTEKPKNRIRGIGQSIKDAIGGALKSLVGKIWEAFGFLNAKVSFGLMGILAIVIDWIAQLLVIGMKALGAVMTGIVVAFGPITWAFAVFPGNYKTIGAWAIRICQFALYGPIVSLIASFFTIILIAFAKGMASMGPSMSILPCVGAVCGMLSALVSVPTIASSIIEGAQGSITLSQGLMTVTNLMSNVANIGERGRDQQMQQQINSMANGGGPSQNMNVNPGGPTP